MQASLWWQPAQHIRMRVGLCQHQAFELPAEQRGQEVVMRQLIAGNWKMHMLRAPASELAREVRAGAQGLACDLLVCPPFTAIETAAAALAGSDVAVGGQDCHAKGQGAHTGDVSAAMLRDAGASWVILGHSERRQNHGETDELVREKVLAAVEAGLTPIVCVGETEDQRVGGQETEVVGWQIAGSLPKPFAGVVAYEPVWAIGTGRTATEQDVATMHAFIREELVRQFGEAGQGVRILYGGSMRPANAGALLAVPHVGGGLIGGASLQAEDFLAIARAASRG
jgi:triosephosphate isomerase